MYRFIFKNHRVHIFNVNLCNLYNHSILINFCKYLYRFHLFIYLQTILKYHDASKRYGIVEVNKACKDWLLHNLFIKVKL